ncbi:receptor-type tyrosine-protein phosphatase eta isoform X2 [Neoarius graeffei]|uniref:receptor-type tyrosine-protein phosphatase eta isoform X2 n=1 Tax=Neoarius graeffei TaxID=443677 RepID=UPI00298D1DB5|nr:receptor-type tyrosine-protein phosphatase eta isoform X2 [Neoarius graeffei]
MLLLGSLLLVVSITCAERDYFYKSNSTTWDDARLQCQACYEDLATITPTNAEVLSHNLTSDYWIGLRQNVSGSKFWSQWANGEPVLYQNWYPGHPIPKKMPEPEPQPQPQPQPQPMCPIPLTYDSADVMQCPDLEKLCACLNSSEDNDVPTVESTVVFPTSSFVTSPTPTILASTSTINNVSEPEYIEDSCVVLLSFGMWQEKQCDELLPYICYDDRFYGDIEISNVTKSRGVLSWSKKADANISHYRVEINGTQRENVTNATSYQIEFLSPGTLYRVQVIPVRCGRNLNAQNISFYTLPEGIRNLTNTSVETNVVHLRWTKSNGTNVSYFVNITEGNQTKTYSTDYSVDNLQPGQMYNFTVQAVVNGTVFGEPGSISVCTRPSKVMNLSSSNNDSTTITAEWTSSDTNSLQYEYKIILSSESHIIHIISVKSSTTKLLDTLKPGTNYTLNVLATEPGCSMEGEAVSIPAYTTPDPVTNLLLTSTSDNINATWNHPNGSFSWFSVTISSNMYQNSLSSSYTTIQLHYTFRGLQAAALYNVSVVTYVKNDMNPSVEVRKMIYTKPTKPGNASAKTLSNTSVNLMWESPNQSENLKNIHYIVDYLSVFWKESKTLDVFGNNSVIIGGLKSGSKYEFNIKVKAGNEISDPSSTTGFTDTNWRTLSLTMMCSSSTQLFCMENTTSQSVLTEMKQLIRAQMGDGIAWNLTSIN